jgi:beta-fructofuranosidase
MLRLADSWVWDSWYADDAGLHHVFFLRASRALGDPDRRHLRASVGHAVSSDYSDWTLVPDALVPSDAPGWDDQAIWTGSTVQAPDGTWRMFYTGISRADGTTVQRIGVAASADLVTWTRLGAGPLLEADPRWYEAEPTAEWGEVAWRDPWVFRDPQGDGWHMLITARANTGDPANRGVVGHAWSPDLETWTVRPPLSSPAGFGQLEVLQVAEADGRWRLLFSCFPGELGPERRASDDRRGDVYLVEAAGPLGPFDIESAVSLDAPGLYAARIVDVDGAASVMGFRNDGNDGFGGEIPDPLPLAGLLAEPTERAVR